MTTKQEVERAKLWGEQCARNGGKESENPYKPGTRPAEYDAWVGGFQAVKADSRRRG